MPQCCSSGSFGCRGLCTVGGSNLPRPNTAGAMAGDLQCFCERQCGPHAFCHPEIIWDSLRFNMNQPHQQIGPCECNDLHFIGYFPRLSFIKNHQKKNKLWIVPRFVQAQDPASIQAEITALFPQLKLPIFSRHGRLWAKQSPNEHHTCPMWLLCSHVRTTELHLLSTTLCACVKCRGTTLLYIYILMMHPMFGRCRVELIFWTPLHFSKNCQDKIGKYW